MSHGFVRICGAPMVVKMGRYGNFMLAAVSRMSKYKSNSPRKSELSVRNASRAKSLNENQRKPGFYMVVRGIRIVILFHGICRLDVIVRKMDTIWYTRKEQGSASCMSNGDYEEPIEK